MPLSHKHTLHCDAKDGRILQLYVQLKPTSSLPSRPVTAAIYFLCPNVVSQQQHYNTCTPSLDLSVLRRGPKRVKRERVPGERKQRVAGERASRQAAARTTMITQYNRDTNAFIRRKVRVVDEDAILQLRIPLPPLPPSWGRAIKPYRPPTAAPMRASSSSCEADQQPEDHCECYSTADIASFDFDILGQRSFQAVLINTGWEPKQQQQQQQAGSGSMAVTAGSETQCNNSCSLVEFSQLPIPKLCPKGFVFVWAKKEHLSGNALHHTWV